MDSVSLAVSLVGLIEQLNQFHGAIPTFQRLHAVYSRERRKTRSQVQDVLEQLEESIDQLVSLETRRQQKISQKLVGKERIDEVQKALEKIQVLATKLINILQDLNTGNSTEESSAKPASRWWLASEKARLRPLKQRAVLLRNSIVSANASIKASKDSDEDAIVVPVAKPTGVLMNSKGTATEPNPTYNKESSYSNHLSSEVSSLRHQPETFSQTLNTKSATEIPQGDPLHPGRQPRVPAHPIATAQVHDIFSKLCNAWFYEEPPEYWRRHETYQKKCSTNTCEWILKDPAYLRWLESSSQGNLLWLSGRAGAGKSTLMSRIIDDIPTRTKVPLVVANEGPYIVAYSYLGLGYVQSGTDVMLSLLEQLCSHAEDVPPSLIRLSETPSPPDNALEAMLNATLEFCNISEHRNIAIVLDAWDEHNMTSSGEFFQVLEMLRKTPWKILISSRDETSLAGHHIRLSEKTAEVSKDITTMAKTTINNNKAAPAYKIFAKNESIETRFLKLLASRADGQFFWVDLKIQLILLQTSSHDITQILEHPAVGMDAVVNLVLEDIYQQRPQLRDMAQTSLLWLSEARRPITLQALQEALAFKAQINHGEPPTLVSDHEPTEEALMTCWKGLVHVDATSHTVVLAHDYLRRVILQTWKDENIPTLGETCIQYLTSKDLLGRDLNTPAAMRSLCKKHQFLDYSGHAWIAHAQTEKLNQREEQRYKNLCELVGTLIRSQSNLYLALALSCFDHTRPYTSAQWEQVRTSYGSKPLLLVSELGREPIVALMLKNAGSQVEIQLSETNADGQTAVHLAAMNGHVAVTRLLIAAGASPVELDSSKKSPLHRAYEGKHDEVFDVLFGRACELWMQRSMGKSRHLLAEFPESEARTLLKHFDALHCVSRDENPVKSLCEAIDEGDSALALAYICRGRDVNGSSCYEKPVLHHAILAKKSSPLLVKELLEFGANPSIRSSDEAAKSPLHLAAERGDIELTRLLLTYGADVKVTDGKNRTALFSALAASSPESVAIAELLLQNRIDIRQPDEHGYQILHEAAISTHDNADFLNLLLRYDADVEARLPDPDRRTPLDLANQKGNAEFARRLQQALHMTKKLRHLRSDKPPRPDQGSSIQRPIPVN